MKFKVKDHFFNKAKKQNFLARSIFKLEEIDHKYQVIKRGDKVLDLGYYPGSWMQYIANKVDREGCAIGVDIQPVNRKLTAIPQVKLFEKDIFNSMTLSDLDSTEPFDVILSDMAPSTTGIKLIDQSKSIDLVKRVVDLLPKFLKERGNLVVKVFDSDDAQNYLKSIKNQFQEFEFLKPKATRKISKEFFVIGKNYQC